MKQALEDRNFLLEDIKYVYKFYLICTLIKCGGNLKIISGQKYFQHLLENV